MTRVTRFALLLMAIFCALPATLFAASDTPGTIVKLTIHDTIQPITADYLQRGLREAARIHAPAVLISMGTPGGLLESTRVMVSGHRKLSRPSHPLHLANRQQSRLRGLLPPRISRHRRHGPGNERRRGTPHRRRHQA